MIQRVIRYMEQYRMLQQDDVVAAGVSGGADSVCLLFLLKEIRKTIPFRLLVVHVNHGIRKEAGEDEAYVQGLCEKWQIPFFPIHADVAALARQQGLSEEEAGRNLRYRSFEQILKQEAPLEWEQGKGKIAVAHNQNDRAETMLFHLFRGTGLSGLGSIQPVRDCIIRPLLCLTRQEIEALLQKEKIPYCIDRTNEEDTYTRNKIRNHLFPYITEEISPAAVIRMNAAADLVTEAKDFIAKETQKAFTRVVCVETGDEIQIDVTKLKKEDSFLQGQLLLALMEKLVPGRKDITSAHVQSLQALCETSGSKSVDLPYGFWAVKEYSMLTVKKKNGGNVRAADSSGDDSVLEQTICRVPGTYSLGNGKELVFSLTEGEKYEEIPQNQYTKWFDYDKIKKPLSVRKRRSGDYLTINEALSQKSLKDYMIQEKIPKGIRDDIWILAEDSHVLWVTGYRISTKYKIDKNTKHILQVQLRGGTSWQNM